jgi:hypothetical protein
MFPVKFAYSIVDEQEILKWAAQDEVEYQAQQDLRRREGKPLEAGQCGAEWKRFYSHYPESYGYYRLTRIGFSHDHRRAYVEINGKGDTWERNAGYWVKWTKRGWKTQKAGGGVSVC